MDTRIARSTRFVLAALASGACLLYAAPAAAMQKTDIITLTNGDHITGEIKNIDQGQVELSTSAMGTVSIEWIHIAGIKSDKTLEVEIESGERIYGSVEPGDAPENLKIVSDQTSVPVPRREVVSVRPIGSSFWKKLNGNVSLGFSFTQASQQLEYSLSANNTYTTRSNRVITQISSSIDEVDGVTTTNRHELQMAWQRDTRWNRWFSLALGGVQHNSELDLDFRGTAGIGMGRYLAETSRYLWAVFGAGSFSQEKYTGDPATQSLEAVAGTTLDVFIFGDHDLSFRTGLQVIPNITDAGRVRVAFTSALNYEIVNNLYAGFHLFDQYDSRPPQAGAQQNDAGVSTTLGYKW